MSDEIIRVDILRDMCATLFRGFVAAAAGAPWQRGYADIRKPPDEPTIISKARLVLPDGSLKSPSRSNLNMSVIRDLFEKLWESRDIASPRQWYGLMINVLPDGQTKVELNYDPDCAVDPTFFES